MKDKITTILGVILCTAFLIGLATTLTRSILKMTSKGKIKWPKVQIF